MATIRPQSTLKSPDVKTTLTNKFEIGDVKKKTITVSTYWNELCHRWISSIYYINDCFRPVATIDLYVPITAKHIAADFHRAVCGSVQLYGENFTIDVVNHHDGSTTFIACPLMRVKL